MTPTLHAFSSTSTSTRLVAVASLVLLGPACSDDSPGTGGESGTKVATNASSSAQSTTTSASTSASSVSSGSSGAPCSDFEPFGPDECWTCSESNACAEKASCATDPACRDIAGCVASCYVYNNATEACVDACKAQFPTGRAAYEALVARVSQGCPVACTGSAISIGARVAGSTICGCEGAPADRYVPVSWTRDDGTCGPLQCANGASFTLHATLPGLDPAQFGYVLHDVTAHQSSSMYFGGASSFEVDLSFDGLIVPGHAYDFVAFNWNPTGMCLPSTPLVRVSLGTLNGSETKSISANLDQFGACELLNPF